MFTNLYSTVVDPKNFDPKSFVEFEGPVCIVPPNSFALARSIEYFRIPRNVMTILGVMPLFLASGAGSASQRAIGTGVVGGMITAVVLAVFFVPLFFVVVRRFIKPSERQLLHDAHETPNLNLNTPKEDR